MEIKSNRSKDNNMVVWLTAGIVMLLLVGYMFGCSDNKIRWVETYQTNSASRKTNPFDVSILKESINSTVTPVEELKNKLSIGLKDRGEGNNYIFVGEAMKMDSADVKAMLNFVQQGNNVLISSEYMSKRILNRVLGNKLTMTESEPPPPHLEEEEITENDVEENDSDAEKIVEDGEPEIKIEENNNDSEMATLDEVVIAGDNTKSYYEYEHGRDNDSMFSVKLFFPDTFKLATGYFDAIGPEHRMIGIENINGLISSVYIKDLKILGTVNNSSINFVSFPYGKGTFYVHSTPVFLTNVEIIEPAGRQYAERLISHLPAGKILWDANNRTSTYQERSDDQMEYLGSKRNNDTSKNNTILKYILNTPSMRAAWYTLLAAVGLFLLFSAKRRQRIIPVLEGKVNTTLEYIQSLGRLYFEQRDDTGLSKTKFKHFLFYVRQRYGLHTSTLDAQFVKRLSQKSGIAESQIDGILNKGKYLDLHAVTSDFLVELHQAINSFYKNCK